MTFDQYIETMDDLKPEAAVDKYCAALDEVKKSLKRMEPEEAVLFIKEYLYGASDNISDMEMDDFFGTEGMRL